MKEYAIGIDIGGTNTAFGLVDNAGEIVLEDGIKTNDYETAEAMLHHLASQIKNKLGKLPNVPKIRGIGIGAPNGNYYRGTIEYAPNLKVDGILNLKTLFAQHFDYPVTVTNDANAAAIGEMIYGGAKGMRDFIVITIGTGLGSGIVVNGQMVYGHDGFAGEIGHTLVVPGGRTCTCGRDGCVEAYVSARGLKQTAMELLESEKGSSRLRKISEDKLNPAEIYEAAESGDLIAIRAFDEMGRILGFSLANSVAYTSPEAIFLVGGLANSGTFLLEPTHRYMEEYLLNIFKGKVEILLSHLKGKDLGILGASALVWGESY